jgi:hypothetical protein
MRVYASIASTVGSKTTVSLMLYDTFVCMHANTQKYGQQACAQTLVSATLVFKNQKSVIREETSRLNETGCTLCVRQRWLAYAFASTTCILPQNTNQRGESLHYLNKVGLESLGKL